MKSLDEIVELATGDEASVSIVLRKCLVLAYALDNDRLKSWVPKELDGYEYEDDRRRTDCPM